MVGETEGKRSLGRPRCKWVDNIRMDFQEIEWDDMYLIGLAQDRDKRALANAIMSIRVP